MQRLMAQWLLLGLLALSAYRTLTVFQVRSVVLLVLGMFAVLAYTDYRRRVLDAERSSAEAERGDRV